MHVKGVPLSELAILLLVSLVLMCNECTARHDMKRRSHHDQSVCRKEFLRPLSTRIADVDLVFFGIVESIYQQVEPSEDLGSVAPGERRRRRLQVVDGMRDQQQLHRRLRHRRHRHLSHHRQSRLHDVRSLSSSLTWSPGGSGGSAALITSNSGNSVSISYRGTVRVKHVIRGDKRFQGNRLLVEGFGSDKFCVSDAKERDKMIFFANPLPNGRVRLHYSLMHYSPENLRKVHIAAKVAASADLETPSSSPSPATETTTATTTTTTTTTVATTTISTTTASPPPLLLQSSQSLISALEAGGKAGASVSTAGNEIGSEGDKNQEAKRKGLKKRKKSKDGRHKRRRKHHRRRNDLTSTSTPATIASSSSTVSLLEEAMMT